MAEEVDHLMTALFNAVAISEGKAETISVEPDGLLSAAHNVVKELLDGGLVELKGDTTEGTILVAVFQTLARSAALISKSSWIARNPSGLDVDDLRFSVSPKYGSPEQQREAVRTALGGE